MENNLSQKVAYKASLNLNESKAKPRVLVVEPMVAKAELWQVWFVGLGMDCEIAREPLQIDARQKAEWFECDVVVIGIFNYSFDPAMLVRDIRQIRQSVVFMAIVSQYCRVRVSATDLPQFSGLVHEELGLPVVEKVICNVLEGKTCKELVADATPDQEELRLWSALSEGQQLLCIAVLKYKTRKAVSEGVYLSEHTVRNQLNDIYKHNKLPVQNMNDIRAFVLRNGLS